MLTNGASLIVQDLALVSFRAASNCSCLMCIESGADIVLAMCGPGGKISIQAFVSISYSTSSIDRDPSGPAAPFALQHFSFSGD